MQKTSNRSEYYKSIPPEKWEQYRIAAAVNLLKRKGYTVTKPQGGNGGLALQSGAKDVEK